MELSATGSLARLLHHRATTDPDVPFAWFGAEGPWTYAQLAAGEAAQRAVLTEAGAIAGRRVVLQVGNAIETLPALQAAWSLGATPVLVHASAPASEAEEVATSTGATGLVTAAQLVAPNRWVAAPLVAPPEVASGSEAVVIMTSGSTGRPKGVPLTHSGAWSMLRTTVAGFRTDTAPDQRASAAGAPNLLAQPLTHTAGLVRLLFGLYVGRPVVLMRKFDAAEAVAAVARHGIKQLSLAPSMLSMLLDLPGDTSLAPVRYVSSGTAPLPEALRVAFEERFGVPVLQTYGQTEAFGAITSERAGDVLAGRRRPGSVGRALPGVEVRVVDDEGRALGPGQTGQIVVRSAAATAGYLGAAPGERPRTDDGDLLTGDVGHLDEDGFLYLTSRTRNVLIVGGFNVYPEEVEAALAAAGLANAVVVGIDDDRLGQVPVVVHDSELEEHEVLMSVHERLAPYKRPRRALRVAAIPVTALGKPDRARVQELVSAALAPTGAAR